MKRILTRSENYRITSEYEVVWLEGIAHKPIVIGDFYGDPEMAIIDWNERWCIIAGSGLVIYYLKQPFEAYQYNYITEQWDECFRSPNNQWLIETVYQVGDNQVRFVVDTNDKKAGVYELELDNLSVRNLQNFSSRITDLIKLLEEVKKAPTVYLGRVDSLTLDNFLNGIYTGFKLFGLEPDWEVYKQIERKRGWKSDTSFGSLPYMKKKGYSEEKIVDEYLAIHIKMWEVISGKAPS